MQIFIIFALFIINFFAFITVGADKRKSVKGNERYPEILFYLISAVFGSLGIFLGMFVFRHKIRKFYFIFGIAFLLIQQIALLTLLFKYLLFIK